LSRLHCLPTLAQLEKSTNLVEPSLEEEIDEIDGYALDQYYTGTYDEDIKQAFDCYLNLPEADAPEENPLCYEHICEQQQGDAQLLARQAKYPEQYINKILDDNVQHIICYVRQNDDPNSQWRIALLQSMLKPTMKWFHQVLGHPGKKRLRETLQQRYYHPQLCQTIDKYKCEHCQKHKLSGRGYGLLPERKMHVVSWTLEAVDLIGPWKVKVSGRVVEFNALTCIDTASNLVEAIRIDKKMSPHVTCKFEQAWLARYPLPKCCIHDMGGEFVGGSF